MQLLDGAVRYNKMLSLTNHVTYWLLHGNKYNQSTYLIIDGEILPWQQLNTYGVTTPFLSLQRVWHARLEFD